MHVVCHYLYFLTNEHIFISKEASWSLTAVVYITVKDTDVVFCSLDCSSLAGSIYYTVKQCVV